MGFFTVFTFFVALVYDVVHGIRHGFDVFDVVVTCLIGAALALNVAVLIKDRRK